MLLFVRDDHDGVFGALITEKWQKKGEKYYGDGSIKVFSFVTDPNGKVKVIVVLAVVLVT